MDGPKCPKCGQNYYVRSDKFICLKCNYYVERKKSSELKSDKIPYGCIACGGPYPSCKTSCNLFDD